MLLFLSVALPAQPPQKNTKPVVVTVKGTPRNDIQLKDIVVPTGFVVLSKSGWSESLDKLLFLKEGILVICSKENSQYKEACLFSESGNFKRVISSKDPVDSFGVWSMASWGDEFTLFYPDRHAFSTYTNLVTKPRILPINAFGDMIERTTDGTYVLYNEHNPSEKEGLYYLNLYNKNGELIRKEMPFSHVKDGFGYQLSGFLAKSGRDVLFSPRFVNTIYEVTSTSCTPRYEFDFGDNIPKSIVDNDFWGNEVFEYSFLGERFIRIGNMLLFDYTFKGKRSRGMFDEKTGQAIDLGSIQSDYFLKLLSRGTILSKDDDEFVLALSTWQLQSLKNGNDIDQTALNQACKDLGNTLTKVAKDGNAVLIYFTYKQGACIPKR